MPRNIIYLDNAATTPVAPQVARAIEKTLALTYGNPSSLHQLGEDAQNLLQQARAALASAIHAHPHELIFTSGGSESNNLAISGILQSHKRKKTIVLSTIEHPSVRETYNYWKQQGHRVIELPVNSDGRVMMDVLEQVLTKNIVLVSVMHANNEFGVLQDLPAIGMLCRRKGVLFHTDAVQSYGKERIDVKKMQIDLLSASGHKIGGPKGIGFLYVREDIMINPLIHGGGQEKNHRSGTENVPGAVGFAAALKETMQSDQKKIRGNRDFFMRELEKLGGRITGSRTHRLANNVHVSFKDIEGESLVIALSEKGIMASTGSACSSKQHKESHALRALALDDSSIQGSLRFSLGARTTRADIMQVITTLRQLLERLQR